MWNSSSLQFLSHFQIPESQNPGKTLCRVRRESASLISRRFLFRDSNRCGALRRRTEVLGSLVVAKSQVSESAPSRIASGSDVVRNFYNGINRRDLESVELLIGEDCVYEDLVFSRPFVGRKEILQFFKKFAESISQDLQFVIDDISNEDSSAVGVAWHLEWQGKPFPFSKGCSFYRLDVLDGQRQIVYARDCVEPATKPGEMALVLIRGVTWILQQFPHLAKRL
ncbi:putative nuclear transport factor 2, NTF2-like domain superfamily [Dioscorea sansibarensis]